MQSHAWPELPLQPWGETCQTVHLWTQIVGKTRLALAPMVNHWWQVPLYVSARGLTTSRIPYGRRGFEVEMDFLSHELVIRTDDGRIWAMTLEPRSVAEFYHDYRSGLLTLGLEVPIWPHPVEVLEAIPFPEDEKHGAYDRDAATRFWRALAQAGSVLQTFRGRFVGKCSPVHFFWGGFDLACTRFSGRPAPEHPGGVPNMADWVAREAYSHECISAGWWPGTVGGPIGEPAFYAYAYPEPPGCPDAPIRPDDGRYDWTLREWILPYDAARRATDPESTVLEFLQSTYETAAGLGGWDREALERSGATDARGDPSGDGSARPRLEAPGSGDPGGGP